MRPTGQDSLGTPSSSRYPTPSVLTGFTTFAPVAFLAQSAPMSQHSARTTSRSGLSSDSFLALDMKHAADVDAVPTTSYPLSLSSKETCSALSLPPTPQNLAQVLQVQTSTLLPSRPF